MSLLNACKHHWRFWDTSRSDLDLEYNNVCLDAVRCFHCVMTSIYYEWNVSVVTASAVETIVVTTGTLQNIYTVQLKSIVFAWFIPCDYEYSGREKNCVFFWSFALRTRATRNRHSFLLFNISYFSYQLKCVALKLEWMCVLTGSGGKRQSRNRALSHSMCRVHAEFVVVKWCAFK